MELYLSWKKQLDQNTTNIKGINDLVGASVKLCKVLGFDFFSYSICDTVPFTRPRIQILGNFPAQWLHCYEKNNYATVDPIIRHCRSSSETLRWYENLFKDCPQLWKDANKHHMRIGITQPSFNAGTCVGLLSLSRTEKAISEIELKNLKPTIKAFTETFYSRASEFNKALIPAAIIDLRQKEKEILRWVADGKTSEEIGRILDVTADTVNFHIRNVQKKLGTCNRVQAVTYAVAQGYI